MNAAKRWLIALLLVALATGGGWIGMQKLREGHIPFAATSGKLPEFSLPDLDGKPRRHDEWLGKVLVVNFWATWCPPCRSEMPTFIEFQQRYGAQGVQFIGVAIDDPEAVRDFAKVYGINFPVLLGGQDGIELARAMGNRFDTLPYSAVFDRQGNNVHTRGGLFTEQALEAQLRPLLH